MTKLSLKHAIGALLIGALVLCAFDFFVYPSITHVGGRSYNKGTNALWLRYLFYFGRKTSAEMDEMAKLLQREQIRDAYFHVRDMKKDGTLTYRYGDRAKRLTDFVHANAPGVRVWAWVYVGSHDVNVKSPVVRAKMINEAKWLCNECGFDGVQWDYEFAPNGDARLLSLLSESRSALDPRKLIGAATPMWYPNGFYLPHTYLWLLGQQCKHVLADATTPNHKCSVVFGLPTYDEGTRAHNNQGENIKIALKGMREGLGATAASANYDGIALFAEYTTTPDEWATYEKYWLR